MLVPNSFLSNALGHGAVSFPPPRQAIDGSLAPWNGKVPQEMPFMFWCASPSASAHGLDKRNVTGVNGQACFWFNNGCDISCDECDGMSGQLVHPRFVYVGPNGTAPPSYSGVNVTHDPSQAISEVYDKRPDGSHRASICANPDPARKATICDSALRTINVDAPCHSELDFYQWSPWRRPGAAPVIDSCGVAGGVYKGESAASAGGDYHNTTNAKRGDFGSNLPPQPSNVTWIQGDVVEVSWVHKAFHGGGYQYRLCDARRELDESCFQATPVPFANRRSSLRWGGVEGKRTWFNATDVSVGTLPTGSTWRRGPVVRAPWGWDMGGPSNEPECEEPAACRDAHTRPPTPPGHSALEGAYPCRCSGWGIGDLYTMDIVDELRIPRELPAGEYVLGWRWDCEQSTQVWSSCSDVTIQKKKYGLPTSLKSYE